MGQCNRNSSSKSCSTKSCLKKFTKFSGKGFCRSFFLNKSIGLQLAYLLQKRVLHKCYPMDFMKFLWNVFFEEHLNATASDCVLMCLARVAGLSICKYRMAKHISNKFGLELRPKSTHKSVLAMIKLLYRKVGSTLFPFFFLSSFFDLAKIEMKWGCK